jgi:selenocysteine lyase/cysteine desulfurase
MTDRRDFVKRVAGAAGAAGMGSLFAAQQAFARELASVNLPSKNEKLAFAALRERYLLDPDITYFNHGSIGTIPRIVHEAHVEYLTLCESNPWLYMWGGAWEQPREEVRAKMARLIGCDPTEVTLTHNTTEGFNLLANGLPLGPGDEVLFPATNHSGATVAWDFAAPTKGFTKRAFDFPILDVPEMTADDILQLFDDAISSNTRLLIFPDIDNIVGLYHPVKEIVNLARTRGVEWIAIDGAQSLGMRSFNISDLGVDVYCSSPHKWVQAPKETGVMFVRSELQQTLAPMWFTWGQQRWSDSARKYEDYGTRDLPAIMTLGDALDFQEQIGMAAKEARYHDLWEFFLSMADNSDRVIWRSSRDWNLSASLFAVEIEGKNSNEVSETMYRDNGFVFRPFHTDELNTLRISLNTFNTEDEIVHFFEIVEGM